MPKPALALLTRTAGWVRTSGFVCTSAWVVGLAVSSVLCACDSGFVKVAEPEPEPEPEQEPEPEAPVEAGVDAAVTPPFFVPPQADAPDAPGSAAVSELADDLVAYCEAQEGRLAQVLEHYSTDDELCRLIAVVDSIEGVTSELAFQMGCAEQNEQCLDEGPERSIDTFVAAGISNLDCTTWSASDACDPSVEELTTCLGDIVENLSKRLTDVGDCESSHSDVLAGADDREELATADTPFVLSNRCASVECLVSAIASTDAGE